MGLGGHHTPPESRIWSAGGPTSRCPSRWHAAPSPAPTKNTQKYISQVRRDIFWQGTMMAVKRDSVHIWPLLFLYIKHHWKGCCNRELLLAITMQLHLYSHYTLDRSFWNLNSSVSILYNWAKSLYSNDILIKRCDFVVETSFFHNNYLSYRERLVHTLKICGYTFQEHMVSPTSVRTFLISINASGHCALYIVRLISLLYSFMQVGIPNSRLRYFLIAQLSTENLPSKLSSKVRNAASCPFIICSIILKRLINI